MRFRTAPTYLALLLVGSVALSACSLTGGGSPEGDGTPTTVTVPTLSTPLTPRAGTPGSASRTPGAAATRTGGASTPAAAATSAPASGGNGAAASDGGSGGAEGKIYVVEEGDTLAVIADKVYGDSSKWQTIYDANKDVIGDSPDALSIGMKLKVPAE
jgi:nucleoid-associated protein YgaU